MRALSLLITLLIFSFSLGAQNPKKEAIIIKVLTFNILHGATMNNDFDLDKIAQVIIDSDADLVALQEVDFKTNRAQKYDLVTELAYRCQMQGVFGKAMDYDGGEYGEGLLSKFSFHQTINHALPHLKNSEPRAALEAIIILPSGDTISFIATHLDHLKKETDRLMQTQEINRIFSDPKYPSILAGDLNATPNSKSINTLENIWTASYHSTKTLATYPANLAKEKIDYIMYQPAHQWSVLKSETICDTVASDHCAYFVSLELHK